MIISTTAFMDGQTVPRRHTGDGEDVSPVLTWRDLPAGARELALIMDDPDAPTPQPWVHWLIYKIPATATGLPEGVPRELKLGKAVVGAMQGLNTWPSDNVGYRGPAPPKGHGLHHYYFKLYALGAPLDVKPGLDKPALLKAMQGHVLAEAQVVGTYERK